MTKVSDDSTGLVSIGELARAAGVSSRTIRYYEELGILPEPRRSPGGTRKYPREYGGFIAAALALKDLGFRLDEVKPLARLAAGRSVSHGQRDAAAQLVEEKIEGNRLIERHREWILEGDVSLLGIPANQRKAK